MMHGAEAKRRASQFCVHRAPRRAAASRKNLARPARIAIRARAVTGIARIAVRLPRMRRANDPRPDFKCDILRRATIDIARAITIPSIVACGVARRLRRRVSSARFRDSRGNS
jgi:hypothetical protein